MKNQETVTLSLPIERGDLLASLYRHGQVLSRRDNQKTITIRVSLPDKDLAPYRSYIKRKKKGGLSNLTAVD